MDPYATHQQALVRTALATTGPMLELGCGNYSTPILAEIAWAQNRALRIQASDSEWLSKFWGLDAFGVMLEHVDWKTWRPPAPPFGANEWGFVFLDSEENTGDRIRRLPALAVVTSRVVLHDADKSMARPHWKECSARWQIIEHYFETPQTVILARRPNL